MHVKVAVFFSRALSNGYLYVRILELLGVKVLQYVF